MVIEQAGKAVASTAEAMKSTPLALALLIVNVGFLGFAAYILGEVAANASERNKAQLELISNLVRDIRDCRQGPRPSAHPAAVAGGTAPVNEDRALTPAGANLVKHFEGCKQRVSHDQYKAYYCPAGVLTIGWGHTNHHGRKFSTNDIWSMKDCDDAFTEDMKGFEAAVRRLVKVKLMPWQADALISFCYNCGEGNLSKSTLLKKVNAGDFEGAALEFHRWNKGGGKVLAGLVRRRASEALLFQNIPDLDYDGEADLIEPMAEPMPQEVDAPKV